jgi:Ni,Fe-hydrogenase III small subunit
MPLNHLLFRNIVKGHRTRPAPEADPQATVELAAGPPAPRLGCSLALRAVDAGSCNGCELELHAATGPAYDLDHLGLHVVASPRHADALVVTGPVTLNMEHALRRTARAVPAPRWIVALGDCAKDGGCFAGTYAVRGGVDAVLPVDLHIPGCPPSPTSILAGLRALLDRVR